MPIETSPGLFEIPSWIEFDPEHPSFFIVPDWWVDDPVGSGLYPINLLDAIPPTTTTLATHTLAAHVSVSAWQAGSETAWTALPERTSWSDYPAQDIELDVTDATITLDETNAPYASAEITCSLPAASDLAVLDPRWDLRVEIALQQTYRPWNPDRDDIQRLFDLALRSRAADQDAASVTIQATSDEALLIDYGLVRSSVYEPGDTTVRTVVAYALAQVGARLGSGYGDAALAAEAAEWTPGTSAWDYLAPIVQASNLRLWCDEQRVWHLDPANTMAAGYVELDYMTTLTRVSDTVTLADTGPKAYYDAVVIDYQWTDANGNDRHTYDTAGTSGAKKTLTLTYATKPQAPGAALRVLKRLIANGRSVDVSAVSRFDATPTSAATIALPDIPPQSGAVASVTWRFPADEMDIVTRDLIDVPAGSWLALRPGTSWNSIPAQSWTDFTTGA